MTDRETLPVAAQETLRVPDRRLDAYYFAFDATGQPSIDAILSAVAHAGKGYHHTESWADEGPGWGGGLSYVDVIQAAAADAARERAALLDALARAKAEVERLREGIRSIHASAGPSQGFFSESGYSERDHCCGTCGEHGEYGVEWPCATVRLLDRGDDQ